MVPSHSSGHDASCLPLKMRDWLVHMHDTEGSIEQSTHRELGLGGLHLLESSQLLLGHAAHVIRQVRLPHHRPLI